MVFVLAAAMTRSLDSQLTECVYVFLRMRGFVLMCVSDLAECVHLCAFSQTLRGGLWSSWVLLLRPFLFSCIRLHLAVC